LENFGGADLIIAIGNPRRFCVDGGGVLPVIRKWASEDLEFHGEAGGEGGIVFLAARGGGIIEGPGSRDTPSDIRGEVGIEVGVGGEDGVVAFAWIQDDPEVLIQGETITEFPGEFLGGGEGEKIV